MVGKRKIKPCLRCGMKDFVLTYREGKRWSISCSTCHLSLSDFVDEETAVKSWNDFSRQIDNLLYEKYTLGYDDGRLAAEEDGMA